ncbi:uncharacterized protein J4E92_004382 [Alternaria infectoria]|uniref:uncharacterized protein n=1 Tax=Alternaria infectoria TaxID=45303 RepID=UPI00221F8EE1|nr:uncharacterized protein J4E92_004382 [Alternaria infectoria]KAI4930550.1 hypothetical protein J4E92_004382 [Alternaria infectoria]
MDAAQSINENASFLYGHEHQYKIIILPTCTCEKGFRALLIAKYREAGQAVIAVNDGAVFHGDTVVGGLRRASQRAAVDALSHRLMSLVGYLSQRAGLKDGDTFVTRYKNGRTTIRVKHPDRTRSKATIKTGDIKRTVPACSATPSNGSDVTCCEKERERLEYESQKREVERHNKKIDKQLEDAAKQLDAPEKEWDASEKEWNDAKKFNDEDKRRCCVVM